jgi:hypothetical protein
VTAAVLEATRRVLLLDYFRVPHRVAGASEGHWTTLLPAQPGERSPRSLAWPRFDVGAHTVPSFVSLGSTRLSARILPDEEMRAAAASRPGSWSPAEELRGRDGERVGAVWRSVEGDVLLPFDPDEAIVGFWSEGYAQASRSTSGGRAKRLAMLAYYRLRPLLPRPTQIALRRLFARIQMRSPFPRWPVETSLHDLYAFLFGLLEEVAGGPVPWLAPWPKGYEWALVLTHDVETDLGYRHVHLLRDVEADAGFRSSWNFVPRRYEVAQEVVDDLWRRGFEVGVHGLYHDGRDLESRALVEERGPAMREYGQRWRAVGFRSPATHRDWELMPLLGFDYDSSYPDTDPFEPQGGGCCSWLPFFNGELVELPITLPQDHTLFTILRHGDGRAWAEKADYLRDRGGMALLITHPDYMIEPRWVETYRSFLDRYRDDSTLWRALPAEVCSWWRRRAASHVEPVGEGWRVDGPAADDGAVVVGWPPARR